MGSPRGIGMSRKKGFVTPIETREKIRQSLMGHAVSKETIEKIRRARIGKPWSQKARQNHVGCHSGSKHWHWKGGKRSHGDGYFTIYQDDVVSGRYEHRLIVEKIIDRRLKSSEIVHHINFDVGDNRPENLYVFRNRNEHAWFHRRHNKGIHSGSALRLRSNLYAYR